MLPSRLPRTLLISILFLLTDRINAQDLDRAAFDADLQRAMQYVQANRMPDAIPILEKLNSVNPNHILVSESLAYALFATAVTDKDAERRKNTMIRAKQLAEKSQKMGNNSQLLQLLLAVPPDGVMTGAEALTKNKDASDALTEGEAAFPGANSRSQSAITSVPLNWIRPCTKRRSLSGTLISRWGSRTKPA